MGRVVLGRVVFGASCPDSYPIFSSMITNFVNCKTEFVNNNDMISLFKETLWFECAQER